jgi:hypothetical protein
MASTICVYHLTVTAMLPFIAVVIFIILPIVLVWRLSRVPIHGDIQIQLLWRGAVGGLMGGIIGATIASLRSGLSSYEFIGYAYWLIITTILGMIFTLVTWAIQKTTLRLNLPARVVIGIVLGIVTVWLWMTVVWMDVHGATSRCDNGVTYMIVVCGIVSGILSGPFTKKIELS